MRKKKDPRFRKEWIISIVRTDSDSTYTYRFCGTEKEVKELLVKMAAMDRDEINGTPISGTNAVNEIEDVYGELYAHNCFCDYSYRYCACRLDNLELVTKYYPV